MILIVGLGNPGMKYKNTYHNVGFLAIDELCKLMKIKLTKKECDARIGVGNFKGVDVILAKPETYMNLSGEAVNKLCRHYNIDKENDLIVCYDDVDLQLGKLRIREEGSAGTHNGMRSIVSCINTQKFKRVRVGTKTPQLAEGEVKLIDFVLSKVDYEYKEDLTKAIVSAAQAMCDMALGEDIQRVQERANRR